MASCGKGSIGKALWFTLFCTGVFSGCVVSEADEDSGPDYLYSTEASYCAALAEAECSQVVVEACYGSNEASLEEDTGGCVSAREEACNPLGLRYHPEAAEACLAKRAEVLEDGKIDSNELDAWTDACLGVFNKGRTAGNYCGADTDCEATSDLRCIIKPGKTSGSCEVPEEVPGGEDCSDDAAVCPSTQFCNPSSLHCQAFQDEGEACDDQLLCGEGFACTGGLCVAKLANLEACTTDAQCAHGFCVKQAGAGSSDEGECSSTWELDRFAASCDEFGH